MANELTKLTPEGFDIANAYVQYGGDVSVTAEQLMIPRHEVVSIIQKPEIKRYIDGIYLDLGYRNRNKLGAVLDKAIDAKLEEAEETGIYTSKDLLELLQFAHKMRMDEIKANKDNAPAQDNSVSVQVAQFGETNYGKLMDQLLGRNNNAN